MAPANSFYCGVQVVQRTQRSRLQRCGCWLAGQRRWKPRNHAVVHVHIFVIGSYLHVVLQLYRLCISPTFLLPDCEYTEYIHKYM